MLYLGYLYLLIHWMTQQRETEEISVRTKSQVCLD